MLSENDARETIGTTAYSADGDKIGKVGQLFLDDRTGRPEFVTVNTGLFGNKETFIPVENASVTQDGLTVPFTKDKIGDAPTVDAEGGHLDESEEQKLFAYYAMSYDGDGQDGQDLHGGQDVRDGQDASTGLAGTEGHATEGHDTSGPTTDDAMTRSEEKLQVGTTSQETGRVRLRKYVTTEEETHTVPVRKERAVLEREPVTEATAGAANGGPDISEEEHEIVLNEERVVVDKVVEPVERVRLGSETVTEEETVTEQVRKEHIETDGDVEARR